MISRIHPDSVEPAGRVVVDNKFYMDSVTPLTVWKKSLLLNCSGYTVYDPNGNLIFRVDNYCSDPKNEVLLMDAAGLVLLTLRRKRLSLQNVWQGFLGELQNAQKPLFVARRSLSLFIPTNNLAEVYVLSPGIRKTKRHSDYHIKGCYAKRSFTFLNSFGDVVAEVKPKQVRSNQINLGGDVFNLVVRPGYDVAFVMGLIIILDQMMPSGVADCTQC